MGWVTAWTSFGGVVLAAALVSGSPAGAQDVPPVLTASLTGKDSFDTYCAPCHGTAGRGDGPVAAALKTRPADLTSLARRNNGSFPRERVRDFVTGTGRTPAAHGTSDMPVWGPLFRTFESDARARVRVDNVVAHVEALQAPTTAPGDAGSQLFRTYCGSCHGTDARGSGPLAAQLRRPPPDLTTFTMRNGGLFPSERVRRIIDGRDITSHGDSAMPVWGDAFRRSRDGLTEAAVAARIGAIVRYLEAIQQRGAE
jgi:mono/diheme cytochrome c family protein